MRRTLAAALVAIMLLVACGPEDAPAARAVVSPATSTTGTVPAPTDIDSTATTAAPPTDPADIGEPVPSTTCVGRTSALDVGDEAAPPVLLDRFDFVLASPLWRDVERSVSVWIDGYGEVLADDADLQLLPASNQKIFTAFGAALELPADHRFVTTVHRSGSDLVVVAGGDPTLRRVGPHSLAALAQQVAETGVDAVDSIVIDASHFEPTRTAPGWLDYQMPAYVGPMSALMVDDNRYRTDTTFVADPDMANGELFAYLLAGVGVDINGPVVVETREVDDEVARVASAPVAELVEVMMTNSDNEVAEALLREIGGGSTTGGVAVVDERLDEWCLDLQGESGDGSGLGRASLRSAREWRRMLQVALDQTWANAFRDGLAVAGRTGTLKERFVGSPAEGIVWAKTGSIFGGRSLSGYTTTADGREVVFSVVINGGTDDARVAREAIDGLVNAIVSPLPA
ncbi:MAG: D-alanyl-D-alanine carboxypeptidase/D-alanyl-D-alanine endopeptidase [Acidimicrobiales bacterium]